MVSAEDMIYMYADYVPCIHLHSILLNIVLLQCLDLVMSCQMYLLMCFIFSMQLGDHR